MGRRRARRRRQGRAASSRSRAASTGSTAASSASSPARSTTSTRTACSSASRSSASPPTAQLRAYRHEGFWDCMDTYKDAVVLNDLWAGGEAPWRCWAPEAVRRDEAGALVTGGHGFVASHLARALLERGDAVARARPPGPRRPTSAGRVAPGSTCSRSRRGRAGRGRPARRRARSAAARRAGCRRGLPPRGADDRRRRPRVAAGDLRGQRARRLERASRPAARTEVARVVVASSDKAYGPSPRAALPRGLRRCGRPIPTTPARRPPTSIARSYWPRLRAAGRGHPLRQHLRRRRPQLLPPDPRDGRSRCSTAARR